jgi:hypothetical protein
MNTLYIKESGADYSGYVACTTTILQLFETQTNF